MGQKPGHCGVQPKVWTDEKLHALGKEMVEFMRRPDVYHIVSFAVHKKSNIKWLYRLFNDYRSVMHRYTLDAKNILAEKYIAKIAEGKMDKWLATTYLPRYLDDKKEAYEEIEESSYRKTKGETKGKIDAAGDGADKLDKIKAAIQGELEDVKDKS